MFADKTKWFSGINCLAEVDDFQQNIANLMSWSCDWPHCFNISKCNAMRIGG